MFKTYNHVLAIGAHPDDIEPQSGGTLAKFVQIGSEVSIAIATATDTGADFKTRNNEGSNAAKTLGAGYFALDIPQEDFAYTRKNIQIVDKFISGLRPDLIICVNGKDSHNDHKTVSLIIQSCCRSNSISLMHQNHAIPGGLNLGQPDIFVDISEQLEQKYKSVSDHKSQIDKLGPIWLGTIKARDRYLGGIFGVDAIEGFFSVCLKFS